MEYCTIPADVVNEIYLMPQTGQYAQLNLEGTLDTNAYNTITDYSRLGKNGESEQNSYLDT